MQYYPPQQQYPVQPPNTQPVQPYTQQPYTQQPYAQQPNVQQPYAQQPYAQQPYVQQPYVQQPYMRQPYIPQPYVQPYIPVYPQPPVISPEEQKKNNYRRSLRRTANGVGLLLMIFFGLELLLVTVTSLFLYAKGIDIESALQDGTDLYFLMTGMISLIIFFLAGLIFCLIKRENFGELFPFKKVRGSTLFKLSVIGLSFSLMSNYVVDLLNNTFGLFGVENSGGTVEAGNYPNILLYFLTVAVLPAFAEEFAFRGVVMGSLRKYSEGLAILISSAMFALMHGNFVQLPFTFCCGLVFAYVDIKTGSLLPSIIIHFLNNALSVLFDVLTSYGVVNNAGANMYFGIIFAVTGVLSLIFIIGMIRKNDSNSVKLSGADDTIPFKLKVKTAATSPTIIIFSVIMLANCLLTMFPDLFNLLMNGYNPAGL